MKRNSRGMLSIIVITILTISFVLPFVSVMGALGTPVLSAYTGTPGTKITVSGTAGNVTSGATVEIYWDTVIGSGAWLLNSTTGKSDGSYTVQITVPESAWANHYVWVKDTSTGLTARSAAFAVTNKISVAPTSGIVGDTITVTGKGFDDEVTVHLNFYNTTGTTKHNTNLTATSPPETNLYGSFTFTFTIPSVDYGSYTVNASDGTNPVVSTALKVGASISLSPEEGPRKTVISIEGRGFRESGVIGYGGIKVDGTPVNITGDAITVDLNGEFTCEIMIGNLPYGAHIINVSDGYYWATATFNVLRNQIDISLESPENVSIGSIVEVNGVLRWDNGTGLGFRHLLVTYRLLYGTQWKELSVIQTDVNGSFKVQWIPQATGEFLLNFELVDGLDNWVARNRTQVVLVVSEVVASGFQLNLIAGWNMVSSFDMEVIAEDVFPGFFQLVTWNGKGYVPVDVMEPGKGYWALVLEDTNITITG